jgi:hypothetical protein
MQRSARQVQRPAVCRPVTALLLSVQSTPRARAGEDLLFGPPRASAVIRRETRVELEHEPAVMLASFQLTIAPKRQRGSASTRSPKGTAAALLSRPEGGASTLLVPAESRTQLSRASRLLRVALPGEAAAGCKWCSLGELG